MAESIKCGEFEEATERTYQVVLSVSPKIFALLRAERELTGDGFGKIIGNALYHYLDLDYDEDDHNGGA